MAWGADRAGTRLRGVSMFFLDLRPIWQGVKKYSDVYPREV